MLAILFSLLLLFVLAWLSDRSAMYVPRGWHFVGPVLVIMIGFAFYEYYDRDLIVLLCVNAPLIPISYEWAKFIRQAGVAYQLYVTGMKNDSPIKTELLRDLSKEESKFTPIVRALQPVFTQTVEMPKFSEERMFARDVLRMYDFDPVTQKHVDTTETRWVKNKKRFAQIPFKNLKDKWVHFGLFKRENSNKNARYIVANREKVALVAAGNPLPEWPPPPPNKTL